MRSGIEHGPVRRPLVLCLFAATLAGMPAARALPNGPEEIMVHGSIDVLATFAGIEGGSGRTGLNVFQAGGIGLYRGVMASGFRSCTDNGCSPDVCFPYSTSTTSRFEGDDFVIDLVCSFAGRPFAEAEWRWAPGTSPLAYDCSAVGGRGTVEQIWAGQGGSEAIFSIDGYVWDTCALLVVDGVGRFSADWH